MTGQDMIISSGELVRRNAAFAATGAFAGLPFPTSDTLQVLGCVDSVMRSKRRGAAAPPEGG